MAQLRDSPDASTDTAASDDYPVRGNVLLVDDDPTVLHMTERALSRFDFNVTAAQSGEEALSQLGRTPWDVIVTDLRMPGVDGLELLRKVKAFDPAIEVVLMSGHAEVSSAVEGMRRGAYDFLTKPFAHIDEFTSTVERAMEKRRMQSELTRLREQVAGRSEFGGMIGRCLAMQEVYQRIEMVAPTASSVLIVGETGTGKELVARAIHDNSTRNSGPFVAVNCGALQATLLESELYGHVKGAFTGAVGTKIGMFEAADGGTLLLDEINSMDLQSQSALLRALETGEIRPVGSPKPKHVDVRILAATNRPLHECVAAGALREDLFYRLSAVTIGLPPLRERHEDIPLLCDVFLERHAQALRRPTPRLAPEVMTLLQHYPWPGNVRELAHAIEQAVVFTKGPVITTAAFSTLSARRTPDAPAQDTSSDKTVELTTLDDFERRYIQRVLDHTSNNKAEAAKILGMPRTSLYKRMQRLGMAGSET